MAPIHLPSLDTMDLPMWESIQRALTAGADDCISGAGHPGKFHDSWKLMSGVCGLRPAHQMPACAVDPMGGLEDQQADRKGQQKSCWIEASPASTAAVLGEYENCSIWFVLSAALCLSSMRTLQSKGGGGCGRPGSPRPLCKIVAQLTRTRQEKLVSMLNFPRFWHSSDSILRS
jgi:hypothetical protein